MGKLKVRAWAVVAKPGDYPMGLPVISEAKPIGYDRRFCRLVRVEIREVTDTKTDVPRKPFI